MPFRPREMRDLDRARHAGQAAQMRHKSALQAALAEIDAAFGPAAAANHFKLRVERMIRFGPAHPHVRARFCARAELLQGRTLDQAIAVVDQWRHTEQRAFAIASALGRGTRLPLEVLRELRLILRLLRFKHLSAQFPAILDALCDRQIAQAAE